jgi:hypothetical protein
VSPLGIGSVVTRVRRSLQRVALVASLLWGVVSVLVVLLAAWLWAGPQGWSQGTWGPLLLDLLLVAVLLGGVLLYTWVRQRWLREARVARCVEDAAGLRPGTVQGSLEVSRVLPRGVSRELAMFGERALLKKLDGADGELTAPLRRRLAGWTKGALAGLAVLGPVLVAAVALTPERSLAAWRGLSTPMGPRTQRSRVGRPRA